MAALGEIEPIDYAIHADTGHERAETYKHAKQWTPWLKSHGVEVVTVQASRTDVVDEEFNAVSIPAFLLNKNGDAATINRQCTYAWKVAPIRQFLRTVLPARPAPRSVLSIQGISQDEWTRMRDSDVQYIEHSYPLVDRRWTRQDCRNWLNSNDLPIPSRSNCTFCPFHKQQDWKDLKQECGPDWDEAVTVDELIRDKRPNMELFVHSHRKPLAEAVSILEDYGASQTSMDDLPGCDSGYCFT